MVTVPVRAAPVFAATLYPTDPFPDPAAPDVIVIHATLLVAVHGQPAALLVTLTVPELAVAGAFRLGGAIVKVHGVLAAAAACITVNVRPATVIVPVRAVPVLAATAYAAAPFPVPLGADVIVIHGALLTTAHAQPDCVWMSIPPVPPAAGMFSPPGEMVYEHGVAAGADCTIDARVPPMTRLPVRSLPVLAVTVKFTVPLPVPVVGGASVIQSPPSVVAVHAQSLAVATDT